MSIRLRFTLLYNVILALTLAVFGVALYSIQAQTTYTALKNDMLHTSGTLGESILRSITNPDAVQKNINPPPPEPFQTFSKDQAFQKLPEREIVRVLDGSGNLVASPFGNSEDSLPLTSAGLAALKNTQDWWETGTYLDQNVLIYSHPILSNGQVSYIIQVARPLTERNRSLQSLAVTMLVASLLTILIAFGIGWMFSRIILTPIQRITQTARTIGNERDFTRRVSYSGPQDEVGQLATTFNSMLARLEDGYQQVAHSLEMQRDFVADVSHELRTPLTTLRGNLGLLRRTPAIPKDEQSDILADMTDESDRMIRLVNDLLVLARADAGRSLAREAFPILPILDETCRQARQLDPQRDIQLEAADLSIFGDRDALKQVLLIGLDNALKHSNGSVVVSAIKTGAMVEIRVQDHGQGIDPEKLEHIFDRFYRGEDSATIPGFGLGLPIAKSLINAMGGDISMQSQLGQGSSLILRLPSVS